MKTKTNDLRNQRNPFRIVDKKFQNRFIIRFFFLVSAAAVISLAIVYFFSGQTYTTVFRDFRLEVVSTADFILPLLITSTLVVTATVGLATVFVAFTISHRIAGPAYRLRQDLMRLKEGYLAQRFRLRDGDELIPLSELLEETARKLQDDVSRLKAETYRLNNIAGLPSDVAGHARVIKEILDNYHV
jgi:signal transduction histidine kinase